MQLSDFYYDLPEERIARFPLAHRSHSRLLCLDKKTGALTHQLFFNLLEQLNPNDLLVCNNTKVIPARLFGHKATLGRVEILVERILDRERLLAHVRASKKPKPGSRITFSNTISFEMIARHQNLFELKYQGDRSILDIIESIGEIPLPPYMTRSPTEEDKARYQTVFAEKKGSVAAPTAGLHFDQDLLQAIQKKGVQMAYVTLHIGSGTFAPVRVSDIHSHVMHSEYMQLSDTVCKQIKATKAAGGRVIAIGTTSARCLETASFSGTTLAYEGETQLFIYPGFQFKCVDALITNFHLPGSTLLMLVSALGGYEHIMRAYRVAVQEGYRFFSYGDAMWIS